MANGTDLKTAQDRMGHANGAITLNRYAHSIPENDQKAAQLVGNLFGTPPKRTQRGHSKIINLGENLPKAGTFDETPDAVGLALAEHWPI